MNLLPRIIPGRRNHRNESAFTLIEIALSIAIVAFALVAIIGILPTGMSVQRDNREDTIINQDGPLWLEAVRNAATNSVLLTNNLEWVEFNTAGVWTNRINITDTWPGGNRKLTGETILGWFCRPKYMNDSVNDQTNRIRARFRSRSGPLANEATNVHDLAFSYLVSAEVIPLGGYVSGPGLPGGNLSPFGANGGVTSNTLTNLWEVRLTMQWPVIRDNAAFGVVVGSSRRTFRTTVASRLEQVNGTNSFGTITNSLWFFRPDTYMVN